MRRRTTTWGFFAFLEVLGVTQGVKERPERRLRVVGVEELARELGVSRSFIYERMIPAGMPSVKVGARRLFNLEKIAAWIERQEQG